MNALCFRFALLCFERFYFFILCDNVTFLRIYKHIKPVCTQTVSYGMIKGKLYLIFIYNTILKASKRLFCTYLAMMIRLCAVAVVIFLCFSLQNTVIVTLKRTYNAFDFCHNINFQATRRKLIYEWQSK